jgi:hypothetical protein
MGGGVQNFFIQKRWRCALALCIPFRVDAGSVPDHPRVARANRNPGLDAAIPSGLGKLDNPNPMNWDSIVGRSIVVDA